MALADYAAEFSEPAGYLDFGRFGPPSSAVVRRRGELTAASSTGESTVDDLMAHEPRARAEAAALVGVDPAEIVLTPNTSTGLFQVAFGLSGVVLVPAGDFPANTYPWHRAPGVTVRSLSAATPEAVREALTDEVTALACSAVDSRTGRRADLAALRDVLGDRLLIVDAIQGFGVVDEPWSAADVVLTGGQKWLRAGWATGFLYASSRALERVAPLISGWTGVGAPGRFDTVDEAAPGVSRFSITNGDPIAAACLADALSLVRRVGVPRIESAIAETAAALVDLVGAAGGQAAATGTGIIPIRFPGVSGLALGTHLAAHGITVTTRPDHVRASVHASTILSATARAICTPNASPPQSNMHP